MLIIQPCKELESVCCANNKHSVGNRASLEQNITLYGDLPDWTFHISQSHGLAYVFLRNQIFLNLYSILKLKFIASIIRFACRFASS